MSTYDPRDFGEENIGPETALRPCDLCEQFAALCAEENLPFVPCSRCAKKDGE